VQPHRVLGSRILADDDGQPTPTTWTVTAIDRHRGAARTNALHTDEILPAGSRFEVFLRWDDPDPAVLAAFLAHLQAWRPLVGHGVTRGRGRATIDEVTHGQLTLDDPDDLLRWLTIDGPDLVTAVAVDPRPDAVTYTDPTERSLLNITMTIAGPLRAGSGIATRDTDDGPEIARLMRVDDTFVIPGSSLKGILRSRCEYILRSIGMAPVPCLDQRCGNCWTCTQFGHGGGDDQTTTTVGQRGRIRIPDTPVVDPVRVYRQHVAIDRFTGGALDAHLFTVEALEAGTFTVIIEALDLAPSAETELRALLRLVLADLADRLIGIGGATTRGYGTVSPDLAAAEHAGALPSLTDARAVLAGMLTTNGNPT
jgi:CRISPR/Cas system CSM-associated protein Csm3 (group 7 of RAMP superfamily)